MWKNFVLTALRNIRKNKTYAFINIFGLSIGLASAILIILFVINELSFDHYHEKSDRIYRLYIQGKFEGAEFKSAYTSKPAGPAFVDEIDGIKHYTRLVNTSQRLIKYDNKKFIEDKFVFADSGVFKVFSLNMIKGDPDKALKEPRTIVLTESISTKYFGNEDPIGKIISVNADTILYTVTGIIEDLPPNTHLDFDMLGSYSTIQESRSGFWLSNNLFTYVLLEKNANPVQVEDQMQLVALKYIEPELEQILGIDAQQFEEKGNEYGIFLQNLKDIHLNTEIEGGFKAVNDKKYVLIFAIIAFFIILIAAINFMNLSTAKSANRAKEVGMRKVVGSSQVLLIRQFIWESIMLSFLSLLLALIMVELLLPYFNNLIGLKFSLDYFQNWYTVPGLILLAVLIGILSGSYPSFVLASFRPVNVLKGQVIKGVKGGLLRNILVVVQFTISIIIIIGTITIYSQLDYMLNKDLGFEKEQVMVMDRVWPLDDQVQTFIQEIEKLPGVELATNSTSYPGITNNSNAYQIKGRDLANNYIIMTNFADYDFLKTFNLKMADGRYFSKDFPSDSTVAIINETAIRNFNIEDPFNTVMIRPEEGGNVHHRIVGVIKDFHYSSLKSPIEPYIILLKNTKINWAGFISIKLSADERSYKATINAIEDTWKQFKPEEPFLYFFLDEHFERLYKEEIRTGRLSLIFSILAIIIASLGLFGLTMFTTEKKTKEIGIRKVMGANTHDIILMIIKDISILMLISIVFAWAVSYKIVSNWLEEFPFRINISIWIFVAAALIAFLIAVITVSIQAYRAARANPVESLHYE